MYPKLFLLPLAYITRNKLIAFYAYTWLWFPLKFSTKYLEERKINWYKTSHYIFKGYWILSGYHSLHEQTWASPSFQNVVLGLMPPHSISAGFWHMHTNYILMFSFFCYSFYQINTKNSISMWQLILIQYFKGMLKTFRTVFQSLFDPFPLLKFKRKN